MNRPSELSRTATRSDESVEPEAVLTLIQTGDLQGAERLAEIGLSQTNSGRLQALLGYVKQQLGHPAAAVDACRSALDLGEDDWATHLSLGLSLRSLGRLEDALPSLEAAHALAQGRDDVAEALLEVVALLNGAQAMRRRSTDMSRGVPVAQRAAVRAVRALRDLGDEVKAKALCLDAIDAFPQAGDLHMLLGHMEQFAGRHEAAVAACLHAVELGTNDWSNHLILGSSLRALDRNLEARQQFRRAYEMSPTRIDAAGALLETTALLDGIDAAQDLYDTMVASAPEVDLIGAWVFVASEEVQRLIRAGAKGEAESVCRKALNGFAEAGQLHQLLGYLAYDDGRYDLAISECEHAIALGVAEWSNDYFLGMALKANGRLEDARGALLRAVARSSQDRGAVLNLLETTLELEGFEHARNLAATLRLDDRGALLSAATSNVLRPLLGRHMLAEAEVLCLAALDEFETGDLQMLLGHIRQQSQRFAEALDAGLRSVALGVEDWSNYLIIGASLKALDRHEEAAAALAHAYRLSPTRLDAAALYLEETLEAHGLDAAESVYAEVTGTVAEPGLEAAWRRLIDAYAPPEIVALLTDGRLTEAQAACRLAVATHGARRMAQWDHYIDKHREWLAFTDKQRPRSAPNRKAMVTVMLITYNHERYIGAALDGCLMQETEYDYEIHVIDDASTDKTQSVALEYQRRHPDKIKTFFNPTNVGTLDPPQQKVTYGAFKRVMGDYLCILEGDDYWSSPAKLQKQVEFLEKNPTFAMCAHNTVKIYEGNTQEPHRFLYWPGTKSVHTIDDAVQMRMFFHTSSIVYRNVLKGIPPLGFRSKWSCDIFNAIAHIQHGEVKHFDDDMSVYRAHAGGSYSNMPALKARIYNIEGLIRYNRWLGYRYLKGFAFSLNRLSLSLITEARTGLLPALSAKQARRYSAIARISGWIYDQLDRRPGLDPAVFWFKEPPKASDPRLERLATYKLSDLVR